MGFLVFCHLSLFAKLEIVVHVLFIVQEKRIGRFFLSTKDHEASSYASHLQCWLLHLRAERNCQRGPSELPARPMDRPVLLRGDMGLSGRNRASVNLSVLQL